MASWQSGIAPDLKSEITSEPGCVGSNPTLAASKAPLVELVDTHGLGPCA